MLSHWCLLIMVGNAEPVVVNQLSITHNDSHPLAQHRSPWLATNGSALPTMIPNHLHSITHHDSEPLAQHSKSIGMWCQRLWIMVNYAEPVQVNHGVLCWASGSATTGSVWHTMIHRHWLTIRHHDSQPLAQYCTPWYPTTGWLQVMVIYAEPVGVSHCV
jgi:hypothetical protein